MDVVFMYSVTQIYGILVHTQTVKKLPCFIEFILVTPSHHRVHHASNTPYLDRNMGMVFIIWDRIFGTFTEELPEEVPHYGVTKPIDRPFHPVHIVMHEWKEVSKDLKKSKSLKDKLGYLFQPPGWAPNGTGMTSKQLQKDWKSK